MFNPRTAVVLVFSIACAALVACRASVGEDVRVTSEAEPAGASSDPSEPSVATKDPMLAPAPTPAAAANEPGGGAASEDAPPASAPDASADVAPALPYTCGATMSSAAVDAPCTQPVALATPGGALTPGGYYLSAWYSAKFCASSTATHKGTMYLEVNDGVTYMRWNISGKVPPSGTQRLTTSGSEVTRTELCGMNAGSASTWTYSTSTNEIVFKRDTEEQKWTRIPKFSEPKLPIDPIKSL